MSEWLWPLSGGVMIGTAAAMLLVLEGRVAGVSGLVAKATGLGPAEGRGMAWRFLAGLAGGGALLLALRPADGARLLEQPWWLIVLAGLLVGYGARLGGGCTSGHGVCGLARGARRSLAATAVFIASGALSVYVVRHVLGGTA